MSNDIQNQETLNELKEYCLMKYERLQNQIVTFVISERGAGKKNTEER